MFLLLIIILLAPALAPILAPALAPILAPILVTFLKIALFIMTLKICLQNVSNASPTLHQRVFLGQRFMHRKNLDPLVQSVKVTLRKVLSVRRYEYPPNELLWQLRVGSNDRTEWVRFKEIGNRQDVAVAQPDTNLEAGMTQTQNWEDFGHTIFDNAHFIFESHEDMLHYAVCKPDMARGIQSLQARITPPYLPEGGVLDPWIFSQQFFRDYASLNLLILVCGNDDDESAPADLLFRLRSRNFMPYDPKLLHLAFRGDGWTPKTVRDVLWAADAYMFMIDRMSKRMEERFGVLPGMHELYGKVFRVPFRWRTFCHKDGDIESRWSERDEEAVRQLHDSVAFIELIPVPPAPAP